MTLCRLLHLQVQLQMQFLGLQAPRRAVEIVHDCYEETKAIITRNTATLSQLSTQYRLGVVSNFSGNLATVCREFGPERFFEVILDSKIVGISKPHPGLLSLALEKLNCLAPDCWFVGDSFERDILPAKALGMRTIWLRGVEAKPCPDPAIADYIITTLTQLLSIHEIYPKNAFSVVDDAPQQK